MTFSVCVIVSYDSPHSHIEHLKVHQGYVVHCGQLIKSVNIIGVVVGRFVVIVRALNS